MQEFTAKIKQMLLLNECGGDESLIYKFSDADGVRTGRSGYSYGVSQFDIENNWEAILTLMDCGFRPKDLKRLYLQVGSVQDLNIVLEASADYIDEADDRHIADMIKHCNIFNAIDDDCTVAMIIDYHNQLRFDIGGKLYRYLTGLLDEGREINPNTIYQFKLNHTAWGRKRPDDVERRCKNTLEVFWG
jgi:hypothetical protein